MRSLQYHFAHRALPEFVFDAQAKGVETFFLSSGATKTLRGFWDKCSHDFDEAQRTSRDGLAVREVDSEVLGRCALVSFPRPEELSEAHLALVVFQPEVRYFVLEASQNFTTSQPSTDLCELQMTRVGLKRERHCSGPEVDANAFVESVEELLRD